MRTILRAFALLFAVAASLGGAQAQPKVRFPVLPVNCPRGLGFGDACVNVASLPGATNVIHPDFFTGYAAQTSGPQAAAIAAGTLPARPTFTARPPWNVAGVDYPVGIPADVVLKDPVALPGLLPAGCTINAPGGADGSYTVYCNGNNKNSAGPGLYAVNTYTPVVFNGWDFTLHGGIRLRFLNWRGTVTLINNKIGGTTTNTDINGNAWFDLGLSNSAAADGTGYDCLGGTSFNPCFRIEHNWINGNTPGDDRYGVVQATIFINGGFVARYNYIQNVTTRFLGSGPRHTPTVQDYCDFSSNYVQGMVNANHTSAHGELTILNGPCGHSTYRYNTFLEPTSSGYPGADISAVFYPMPGPVSSTSCPKVTFTGTTGTVDTSAGNCTADNGTTQLTAIGDNVRIAVTDASGLTVLGSVQAVDGQDWKHFGGATAGIRTFTMSAANEIPSGVAIRLVTVIPQFDYDHNVMVTNLWNVGRTGMAALFGGWSNHDYGEITLETNWLDPTGALLCFTTIATAQGTPSAVARALVLHASGNYNLANGGALITGFDNSTASGCKGGIPNSSQAY